MSYRRIVLGLLSVSCAVSLWAGEPAPAELRGDWVPASASCGSSLRFRVSANEFELQNGADHVAYGNIGWPTSYFGPDYQGIVVTGIADFDASQPFTAFFNADEKKGTTKLNILQGEESPTNAAYNAIVRTAKKLNARFPLDNVPLKRCGAPAQAEARDVSGDYTYQGKGIARVAQQGADVRILLTWTPMGTGPHYEVKGKIQGDTITGQWYSHYAKKGWFRFVGKVAADGSIDLAECDDPINANVRKTVLVKRQPAS